MSVVHSSDVLYLDDQPQLCKYANQYPYLEQSTSIFEGSSCSNRWMVLDARTETFSCTESGSLCSLHLSVVEEYLPTRYLVDLWLVYSNGVEFSVVLLFPFCVKVTLRNSDDGYGYLNMTRIELLALPENIYPFQLVNKASEYFSSAELHVSRCILGMDVGGPVVLLNPWKESSTHYSCAILVCNYSILFMKASNSSDTSCLVMEHWVNIEQLSCITSAILLSLKIWSKEEYTDDDDDRYSCLLIGTIQGSIEWICMNDRKPKKICQMKTAIKNLLINSKFLVSCDEIGDVIMIPLESVHLSLFLDKPLDERFMVTFSLGCIVQLLETMDDHTFLMLSNSGSFEYWIVQREQETVLHHGESNFPTFHCKRITLIGPNAAYVGWTLYADFHNQKEEMVFIAMDGSFLVLSSTAISNCIRDRNFSPTALSSDSDGTFEELNSSASHLFQQMDNLTGIQQRYEQIFREFQQEMSRLNSLLHWYDEMRNETLKNGGGFQVAIKQVRRIETGKKIVSHHNRSCDEGVDDQIDHSLYHIIIEWTYHGTELWMPFSILVQWKNISCDDDIEILSQHTFQYDQLTTSTHELMEIPLYKTNGLYVHFRIFFMMSLDQVSPLLSHMSHRYPVWLELSCERSKLDVLDFCEPIKIRCNDDPIRKRETPTITCRMSNPYQKSFHSSSLLLPPEWNLSENDWFVPIKTPWNECIILIHRVETIVIQCSSLKSLALFHSCLWKRLNDASVSQPKQLITRLEQEEKRWRDNDKVILHSLQQAQNELQQAEQVLEKMRRSNDCAESIQNVIRCILEAYRMWRGCCFVITSHTQ
ncbi:hypothetical protein Gasu2_56640 [Galdieria sulphuraria]|nr:hypothetical protein Gasu2_56640 [Galdieria sulphuraria]